MDTIFRLVLDYSSLHQFVKLSNLSKYTQTLVPEWLYLGDWKNWVKRYYINGRRKVENKEYNWQEWCQATTVHDYSLKHFPDCTEQTFKSLFIGYSRKDTRVVYVSLTGEEGEDHWSEETEGGEVLEKRRKVENTEDDPYPKFFITRKYQVPFFGHPFAMRIPGTSQSIFDKWAIDYLETLKGAFGNKIRPEKFQLELSSPLLHFYKLRQYLQPFHCFYGTQYWFYKLIDCFYIEEDSQLEKSHEWMCFGHVDDAGGNCGQELLYINVNKLSKNFGKIKSAEDGDEILQEFESFGQLLNRAHATWVQHFYRYESEIERDIQEAYFPLL
eukprot:TRINITY_DN4466_c0_g6_i1.p1 TRINITY_DN4466_c0_g6~~TRINITY_DN4466_c0_g6_i1.p1  ORF type:complete len:328 (+),score=60.76 TRINITY_DN4466_c0_g6_i1:82-1065(+)